MVSGELDDGTEFSGVDTIRVIGPATPSFVIKKLKLKISNKKQDRDRFKISGTIDVTAADIAEANNIQVTIWSADVPVYSESIDFDPEQIKKGKYRYRQRIRNKHSGAITHFRLNLKKHKFFIKAKNLDLSALGDELSLEVEVGDYAGIADWL